MIPYKNLLSLFFFSSSIWALIGPETIAKRSRSNSDFNSGLSIPVLTLDALGEGRSALPLLLFAAFFLTDRCSGIVLQTALSLIKSLTDHLWKYLQNIFTPKA